MWGATLYGNPVGRWLLALVVAAGVAGAARGLRELVRRRLRTAAERTPGELDDLLVDLLGSLRPVVIAVLAVAAGSLVLDLPVRLARVLQAAAWAAVWLQVALWGNAVITWAVTRHLQRRLEQDAATATTVAVLSFVARVGLWAVLVLVALDNLGVNITALVAGVGIGGVAVALALQNVLGDLFAAFSIALDRPFVIGDFIITGDVLGTVEHIGLKTTRVRSLSGEQVVLSNTDLLSSRIRNFKRMTERRVLFTFGVVYDTPPQVLADIPEVVRRIVEAQPRTRFDRAHFKSYGDFALIFEVVYYVLTPDYTAYMDVQQAINLELYRQFRQRGIQFAYPTQTVHVHAALPQPQGAGAGP